MKFFEELIAFTKKNEFKNSKQEQLAKALATMLEEEHRFFEKGDNEGKYLATIKEAVALAGTYFPDTMRTKF